MKKLTTLCLLPFLFAGTSHAGTVPCNGYKIDFRNTSQETLVIDVAYFSGGVANTSSPLKIAPNENIEYTVNQTVEGNAMDGEFLFHTPSDPSKELRLNFRLTNNNVLCDFTHFVKRGSIDTSVHNVPGGVIFNIK